MAYYDPYIPVIGMTREHADWAGTESIPWNKETLSAFDAVVIATAHSSVNYQQLADWTDCIVDTRNAMAALSLPSGKVWKA